MHDTAREIPPPPGVICDLDEAIATWIGPGMVLHIDPAAQAAVRALMRVFRGTRPGFTVVMSRAGTVAPDLIQAGLVQRLIAGGIVNAGLRPGASAAVQGAFRDGTVQFEHWSLYSIVLRLMAGALQWPIVPSRSIAGSTMAERNTDAFATVADPFSGTPVHLMRALVPDISLLHAACADHEGNALFVPPYEGEIWGAKASRMGVLLSAERIVPTQSIRRHPHFVRLSPASVRAVSPAPFSGHPYRVASIYPDVLQGYRQDSARLKRYAAATGDKIAHERWLEEWVYGLPSHTAYLDRIGQEHLMSLLSPDAPAPPRRRSPANHAPAPPSVEDRIVVAAARRIVQRVLEGSVETILVGNGLAALPCAVAFHLLREAGRWVQLVRGTGTAGWEPLPGQSEAEMASALMLCGTADAYGVLIGGQGSRSLAVLSAAQIDRFGNLNSTELHATSTLLTGSGGANDAASLATEVLVVARDRPDRFVNAVDFVTAPGDRVSIVVTDFGVLSKQPGCSELQLSATFAGEAAVEAYRSRRGLSPNEWRPSAYPPVRSEPDPTGPELAALARSRSADDDDG